MPNLKEPYRSRIELWLSTKYKRCERRLRVGDCRCFLGVGCELSGLGEWVFNGTDWVYRTKEGESHAVLPREVREYYGLNWRSIELAVASDSGEPCVFEEYMFTKEALV